MSDWPNFERLNTQQEHIRWEQKKKGIMTEKELQDHLDSGELTHLQLKQLIHEEIVSFLRTDDIMGDIFDTNDKEFLSDSEMLDCVRGMKVEIEYLKGELDRHRRYLRESREEKDYILRMLRREEE